MPPADIPVALSCMDVIVSPSLMESFSLSNIEAMAMGVPLLHFNVGGVRDYARHLVNSFVVSEKSGRGLADGMLTLVRDPNMRAVLSAGGQKAAQRYSPTVIGPHGAFVMR